MLVLLESLPIMIAAFIFSVLDKPLICITSFGTIFLFSASSAVCWKYPANFAILLPALSKELSSFVNVSLKFSLENASLNSPPDLLLLAFLVKLLARA